MLNIVLPAYNEAESLNYFLPQIISDLKEINFQIYVIDSQSPTDNTAEICKKFECNYVKRVGGDSYGDAIRTAISLCNSSDMIVMDADGSHNPRDILKMIKCQKSFDADIVIGSRYCQGGGSENGVISKLMSLLLNSIYKLFFHLDITDLSDSFRLYKAHSLTDLALESQNFDIIEEILIKFIKTKKNAIIKEIPINFRKRKYGSSKRKTLVFIFNYIKTLFNLLKIK